MRKLRWILMLVFLPFLAEATHQVGAYISLQYMGGTTYQATIVDFINGNPNSSGCNNSVERDTLRLYWGDGTSEIVNLSNGNGDSLCPCRKIDKFIATHTYAGPGNYTLSFEDPDRLALIQNIPNSVNQPILVFNTLSINRLAPNISFPVITNQPVCTSGCPGQCYTFNLDAYSPAGDSLSYSLGDCLPDNGYFIPVNTTINPVTGTLSWCNPTSLGFWSFSIRITSYYKAIISGHPTQIPVDTEEVELSVVIDSACLTGINEIKNSAGYSLYPNPSIGIFTISFGNAELVSASQTIEIYNVFGQKVRFETLKQIQGDNLIDLTAQPDGIYLYRILNTDAGIIGEGKLIIQK